MLADDEYRTLPVAPKRFRSLLENPQMGDV